MNFTMTKKLKRGRNEHSADANIGDDDFILVDLDVMLDQEEPSPVALNHVLDDDEAIDRLLINSGFEADDDLNKGEREPDALLIDDIDLADDLTDFGRFVIEPVERSEKDQHTQAEESTVPDFYPRAGFDEIVSEEDAIDRLLVDDGFDARNKPEDADRVRGVLVIDEMDMTEDFRDLDQSVAESAGQPEKDKLTGVEEVPVQDIYSGDVHNKILAEDANDEVREDAGAPNVLPIDGISGANGLALDKGSIQASLDKEESPESVKRERPFSGATYQEEFLCSLNKEAGATESSLFISGQEAFNKQLGGYEEKVKKAAMIAYVSLGFGIVALLSAVVMGVTVLNLQAKVSKLTDLVSIIEEDMSGVAEKNSAMEMSDSDSAVEQSNQKLKEGPAEPFAETDNPLIRESVPGKRKGQLPSLLERSTSATAKIAAKQSVMNNSIDNKEVKAPVMDKKKPSEKALKISSVNKITKNAKAASVWSVNLIAYNQLSEAKRKAAKFIQKGIPVEIKAVKMNNAKWYRLKVGGFKNKARADSYAAKIKKSQNLVSVSVSNN